VPPGSPSSEARPTLLFAHSSMESKPCFAIPIEASSMYSALGNLSVNQVVIFSPSALNGANGSNQPPSSDSPFCPPGRIAPLKYFAGSCGVFPDQVSKCRWTPLDRSLIQDQAIIMPLATASPFPATNEEKWR